MPLELVPFGFWLLVASLSLLSGMCFGRALVMAACRPSDFPPFEPVA